MNLKKQCMKEIMRNFPKIKDDAMRQYAIDCMTQVRLQTVENLSHFVQKQNQFIKEKL